MRYVIGTIVIILSILMMRYTVQLTNIVGKVGMAEDYLASRGGDKLLADIPLGRVADPDEVGNAAAYLALEAPPSMTGAVLDINGASFVR